MSNTKFLLLLKSKTIPISGLFISSYLIFLAITDNLNYYIHPDYKIFATVMCSILFLLSIFGLFFYKPHAHDGHDHENKKLKFYQSPIIYAVVIFILGFIIAPSGLTSNTALRRGIDNENPNFSRSTEDVRIYTSFGQDTRTYDISTWLKVFSYDPEATDHVGKKVSVTGFYHKTEKQEKGTFYVSRYVITCCSIDARPVGILVKTNETFSDDTWIRVEGELSTTTQESKLVPVIMPTSINKIDKPSNPYLY